VLHIPCRLVLELDSQVDNAHARLHVVCSHIAHPSGNGRREKQDLEVAAALPPALSKDLQGAQQRET